MERRQFFRVAAAGALGAASPLLFEAAAVADATVLSGTGYAAKFTQQLKRPPQIALTGDSTYAAMNLSQFTAQVLTGYPATTLWGYSISGSKPSWPGPTIRVGSNKPVKVTWRNRLPVGTKTLAAGGHLLPVDDTLLDASMSELPAGQIPIVTHLHGAHVEWQSDGYPEAWYTQDGHKGAKWVKAQYTYDNSQVGGTLWYHDHAHGITRLNIYAGLAGAYLIRDSTESKLISNGVLPGSAYEYELLLQDRKFTDDGQLFLDTSPAPAGGIALSTFGDFAMVNGLPWPVLDVEPRQYRFRLINGSDSRIYVLQLDSGAAFTVTGTELGLLPKAVGVTRLAFAPGERYDLVIDFTGLAAGTEVILQNDALDGPLTGFAAAGVTTNRPSDTATGFGPPSKFGSMFQVMKFRVSKKLSKTRTSTVVPGTALGKALPVLTSAKTRGVITFFGSDGEGRQMEMLGTLDGGTQEWMDPATEIITKGTTETWEIYNCSGVAHPIHLHLVDFQVLDRAPFTFTSVPKAMSDGGTGAVVTVTSTGTARPPEAYEAGRKDTVICYPGEVTRVIANFDRAGNYVWHCHILHHEDHDMMRPVTVQ